MKPSLQERLSDGFMFGIYRIQMQHEPIERGRLQIYPSIILFVLEADIKRHALIVVFASHC